MGPLTHVFYTVQSQDRVRGLRGLAFWIYGEADYWVDLYEQNRGIIGADPIVLAPGQHLIIPCEPSATFRGNPLRIVIYVVQPQDYGNGLAGIALRHYGYAQFADAIYRINRGVIGDDPAILQAGQRLILP